MVSKFNELVKSSSMVCGSFSSTFDLECLYTYLEITGDIVHITFDKKKKSKSGEEPFKTFKSGVSIKTKNGCSIKIFASGSFQVSGCGNMDVAIDVAKTTLTKLLCNVKKIKCKKEIILGNFNGFYTIYSKKIVSKNSEGEYTFDNFYKNNKVFINGKECVSFHLFPEVYIEKTHTDKIKKLYNNLAVCIGQVEYLMVRKCKSLCIKDCKYVKLSETEYDIISKFKYSIGKLIITLTGSIDVKVLPEKICLDVTVCSNNTELGEIKFLNSNCNTSYIIPKDSFVNREMIAKYLQEKQVPFTYDPCSYPGVKFSYGGVKITIFRTGSILFSSKVDVNKEAFPFIKQMFNDRDLVCNPKPFVVETIGEEPEEELSIWDI